MKLLVINPNTSAGMTAQIAAAARAAAAPGTDIVAVQPDFGAPSIEGHFDDAFAAAGVAQQARLHGADADGVVVACFGDPGLDAAREATAAPVIGIAEAAFHAASFLATGFSVVTTMTRTCTIADHLLHKYGFERRCRGVHGTDIPVLDLESMGEALVGRIEAAARTALERDRSGAIVLGCAGMADLALRLQQRLGVPVIDGVAAAVKFAESLAALSLRTSRRGDYAPPLPKPYAGWAAGLSFTAAD
ncbi:aspartate/glutamate racemase family protein [Aquincola sp. MAHUQ-54]|uniref:Hydantoin racemase n=1 Tax=Aquincola agrisoli TaxID=3119538 RepID=A0AAW9Q7C3_9BURK